ncbi:N-(5'-phosphoribosyl)anthranilate isomerase [Cereibacter changlensis JA139]|uniref:N-(5'-phosphoribosyl)anthranilate isomerase n=2 Tax=Cereibacter changlensis TaxID=402884 RepID=A0A2T4JWT2_9RHOB|nr:N-(5'-phosphoribosyl)anthranilate isomerase [Cereibacter changlensis]PTE22382.1 N-(5'-phosphoribosyl)anthranilate isomerase [Cereibacter changlensis JA139]PZX57417.1 hypothetical protein LX76_00960 [Cereibacter changlensis]
MDQPCRITDPETWIALIFAAKAAKDGVIRRSISWVDREVGRDRFLFEVRRRGFHLLMAGDQFVIVCDPRPVHILF